MRWRATRPACSVTHPTMGVANVAAFLHQQDLIARADQGGSAKALADLALPADGEGEVMGPYSSRLHRRAQFDERTVRCANVGHHLPPGLLRWRRQLGCAMRER